MAVAFCRHLRIACCIGLRLLVVGQRHLRRIKTTVRKLEFFKIDLNAFICFTETFFVRRMPGILRRYSPFPLRKTHFGDFLHLPRHLRGGFESGLHFCLQGSIGFIFALTQRPDIIYAILYIISDTTNLAHISTGQIRLNLSHNFLNLWGLTSPAPSFQTKQIFIFFDSPKTVFKTVDQVGYDCAPSYNLPATVKGIYSPHELFSDRHRTREITFRIGSNI